VAKQKSQAMDRIEGEKDAWRIADMGRAQDSDNQKKNRHDGAKKAATRAVPRLCAQKSDTRIRMVIGRI